MWRIRLETEVSDLSVQFSLSTIQRFPAEVLYLAPEPDEPFRQLTQGVNRTHGGVGLGLYIVRNISDLMNGELRVDDNPAGGSIFTWTVRLPLALDQSHTSISVLDSLAVHRGLFPSLRCVVFEDTPSNQLVIGRILELAGHTVTFHDRGESAAAKIAAARADVVFLDLHMPGVSGLDVIRKLAHQRAVAPMPPVVVLTADVTKYAAETSHAFGVAEYLVKPISVSKLLGVIERLHPEEQPRTTNIDKLGRFEADIRVHIS